MNTHDLIDAMARDPVVERETVGRALAAALPAAMLLAAATFYAIFGLRPDLAGAAAAPTLMKLAIALSLAVSGGVTATRLARPGASVKGRIALLGVPLALLLGALAVDLSTNGLADWRGRLFGQTSLACMTLVTALATPPLIALIAALRRGAPDRPTLTGLVAGLTAAGLGAGVYAIHCPEDSPLFFAAWYGAATLAAASLGAIGGRFLRW